MSKKIIIIKRVEEELEIVEDEKAKKGTIIVNPADYDDIVKYLEKRQKDFY